MLGKPDRGCVDGPLSSPPCIFHFFLVLSKTIQALTQPLQPDGGQLQKELSLKTGHILGGNSISHGRYDFLNTACSPSWGPLHCCLCNRFPPSPLTHRHMHTHLCAHTHTQGAHMHKRYTQAHKDTHIHTQMHTGTQSRHRHTHMHTSTHMCTQRYTRTQHTGTHVHTMKTQVHTQAHTHSFMHAALAQGPSDNLRTGCAVCPAWVAQCPIYHVARLEGGPMGRQAFLE